MYRRYSAAIAAVALTLLAACTDQLTPVEPIGVPPHAQPLLVVGPGSFSQVTTGKFASCALRSDGAVECWGSNTYGQAPPAAKVAAVGTFTAVSGNALHTCALRSDGVVECWGYNEYGQAPSTKSAANGSFTAVAVGEFHSCAVRTDGAVECWGWNQHNQAPATAVEPGAGKFTAVAGGFGHSCALRTDGEVKCWGSYDGLSPTSKTATTGVFTALDSDGLHACGLRDDGAVECWGSSNGFGQAPAEKKPADETFTAVSTSDLHTCALRSDGAVECWGRNEYGQAPAMKEAADGEYTSVAAGDKHTCALRTDGVVECWGLNSSNEAPATRSAGSVATRVYPTATFTAPASVNAGQSIQLALTGAAVPGHPEATTFTYAFDCGTGYGLTSTTASANCPTTTAGSVTVKGKVIDKDGDATEYTKTVNVLGSTAALAELRAAVANAALAKDLRRSLLAKLDAAAAALAKNKQGTACAALSDFREQVTSQRGKAIPVATADAWLSATTQIENAIGCSDSIPC